MNESDAGDLGYSPLDFLYFRRERPSPPPSGRLSASPRPGTDMTLTLTVDGREVGPVPAHLSGSHLMLPLTAFASAGFRPLLDTENGLVDLAGCLRVSLGSPRRCQTGGPAVVRGFGGQAARLAAGGGAAGGALVLACQIHVAAAAVHRHL